MSENTPQRRNKPQSNTQEVRNAKTKTPMSMRSKIGWIAVSLAALLVYGILRYKSTGDVAFFELNRTCLIMILLWLAWPELEVLPRWILYAIPVCVGVCAWRPQYTIVVLPLCFFYLLLFSPARRYRSKKNKK